MIRGYGVLSVLALAFTVYCLLDIALTEADRVRSLPKPTWVLVVLLLPVIGGVVWFVLGRPATADLGPGGRRSGRGRSPNRGGSRPRGPEDDPRFLRDLDDRLRRMQQDDDEDGDGTGAG